MAETKPEMNSDERAGWFAVAQKIEGLRAIVRTAVEQWQQPSMTDIHHGLAEIQGMADKLVDDKRKRLMRAKDDRNNG